MAAEYIPKVKLDAEIETYELFEKRLMSIQVDFTQRVGNWFGFVFRCIDSTANIDSSSQVPTIVDFTMERLSSLIGRSLAAAILKARSRKSEA
jgi:hypothetical protein